MRITDIRKKSDDDLQKELRDLRSRLRELRFKVGSHEMKNHQQLRGARKDIARILTILKERT